MGPFLWEADQIVVSGRKRDPRLGRCGSGLSSIEYSVREVIQLGLTFIKGTCLVCLHEIRGEAE